jgi:prepilin-type N-terminal cleavage/methylation domain-containing protein
MVARNPRGFTLLELLVVTSIIGILASIAIPQYASFRARGFDSMVSSAVRNVATGEEAYYAAHKVYAADVNMLEGMNLGDVEITITPGNSGDISSSFRIHGRHDAASHEYEWVSDPAPGEPNFLEN